MSNLQLSITGVDELINKIKLLGNDKDKRKESLVLLREIARSTLNVAKAQVPVASKKHKARGKVIAPGNLKKSLGFITSKSKEPTVYVGPRAKRGNDGWYGHFVHEGINVYRKGYKRKRKKGANNSAAIRRTRANPFLRRAYEQTQGKVTAESEQRFARFLQKRIDKLSR